jgi:hypothetical protein
MTRKCCPVPRRCHAECRCSDRSAEAADDPVACGRSGCTFVNVKNAVVGGALERRKSTRYLLHAPVVFSWTDSTGASHQGGGFTLNISPAGVFVLCNESQPPVYADVTLEVTIPSIDTCRQGVRLKSSGQVLRVEEKQGYLGFAAATEFSLSEERYLVASVQ